MTKVLSAWARPRNAARVPKDPPPTQILMLMLSRLRRLDPGSRGLEHQRSFFPASLPEVHSKTSVIFRTRRERHFSSALFALTIPFIFS